MEEIWKVVILDGVEFPREVSNFGNVRSTKTGKSIAKWDNGSGYLSVFLINSRCSCKKAYIHRLVAYAFLQNPLGLPQVNHIDCDKSNNNVLNLEWVRGSDNIQDAHAKGRMKKRGELGRVFPLSRNQVVELYTSVKRDKVGIGEKARGMGIPRTTASSIINKRSRADITDHLDAEFQT